MINDYKNAMDRIKADDKFKAQLLERLAAEQEKPKVIKLNPPAASKKLPLVASLASAAVLALLIYSSAVLVLPMLRNNAYDGSSASPESAYSGRASYYGIQKEPRKSEKPGNSDKDRADAATENADENENTDSNIQPSPPDSTDNNTDFEKGAGGASASDNSDAPSKSDQAKDSGVNYDDYRIVSYSGIDAEPKGTQSAENTVSYNSVLHFTFEGFDKYGIKLKNNDIVFDAKLSESYTLAQLFTDYYNIIIGRPGSTSVSNGMLDSFFNVSANTKRQISVFIDGVEVVNLDNVMLAEFSDLNNVYFSVSVT